MIFSRKFSFLFGKQTLSMRDKIKNMFQIPFTFASMLNDEKENDKISNWKSLEKYIFVPDAIKILLAALG